MIVAAPRIEDRPFKDSVLAVLAEHANIAQFVSFGPDLTLRHSCLTHLSDSRTQSGAEAAVRALLEHSSEGAVNIRSFVPDIYNSTEFVYGLDSCSSVLGNLERLSRSGWYTIVNETLTMTPGAIGGVLLSDVLECAPGETPRCVEKPGVARFPRAEGIRTLEYLLGTRLDLRAAQDLRIEFTVHPLRVGVHREHVVVWEVEQMTLVPYSVQPRWPNKLSRATGDKAYGLLLAHVFGLPVPRATVIGRAFPPCTFGRPTKTEETWLRPCPPEPIPGALETFRGWQDPSPFFDAESADSRIASVLAQAGVDVSYSGALVPSRGTEPIIEGVRGFGQRFMRGEAAPEVLPAQVTSAVRKLYRTAEHCFGPSRLEWAYDVLGDPWVLQLQPSTARAEGPSIFPGTPLEEIRFEVSGGLEALRDLVEEVRGRGVGIVLVGSVGITSHFGDVLRRAKIPSRLEAE